MINLLCTQCLRHVIYINSSEHVNDSSENFPLCLIKKKDLLPII